MIELHSHGRGQLFSFLFERITVLTSEYGRLHSSSPFPRLKSTSERQSLMGCRGSNYPQGRSESQGPKRDLSRVENRRSSDFISTTSLSVTPKRPGLTLTSCRLIASAITPGASHVAAGQLCMLAVAITPAGLMGFVRSYCPISGGPPDNTAGWLLR